MCKQTLDSVSASIALSQWLIVMAYLVLYQPVILPYGLCSLLMRSRDSRAANPVCPAHPG